MPPKRSPEELRLELKACAAIAPDAKGFNRRCVLPYRLSTEHVRQAMQGFTEFLAFVNLQLNGKGIPRLETMLMPANFSSMVGEFISANVPRYCASLVKNRYHNGHPDMIPAGKYPGDAAQHVAEGIEIKASRYLKGWQGHNPEDVWLSVFVFESGRPTDEYKGVRPIPFRFLAVYCARLKKADWQFAGRSEKSRRTITASVRPSGYEKMVANWVYRVRDRSVLERLQTLGTGNAD
jgi:hypothetical protein